jgi:hypothetical protein
MTLKEETGVGRGVVLSPQEAAAAEWARTAIAERLPRLRKSAATWATTWSGIFTLVGIAEVFGATETVRGFKDHWAVYYSVVTVLGLVLAAASVLLASWAAASSPREIRTDIASAVVLEDSLFASAQGRLRAAHLFGGIGVLLVAASFFLLWVSPAAPAKDGSGDSSSSRAVVEMVGGAPSR